MFYLFVRTLFCIDAHIPQLRKRVLTDLIEERKQIDTKLQDK